MINIVLRLKAVGMDSNLHPKDGLDERSISVGSVFPRPISYLSDMLHALIQAKLWLQILIAMVSGIIVGIIIGPTFGLVDTRVASIISDWFAFPGLLFLSLIQMIVIPLVFASIIRGLAATQDLEQLKQVGLRAGAYFVTTTFVAIFIGISLATVVQPGKFIDTKLVQAVDAAPAPQTDSTTPTALPTIEKLPEVLITLLPSNPLSSMVHAEMLQVVIFAMVFGVALVMMPPQQSKPMLDLFGSLQEVCMTVVRWAMLLAPLAVFGLILRLTAKIGPQALIGVSVYVATVLGGLLLLFAFYMGVLWLIARISPIQFVKNAREALLLAFSTSSSAAVMPLTMRTLQESFRIRPSVAQFVVPLGATVNMDGTALYQAIATVFLAQAFGVDMSVPTMILLGVTAVGASIGTPSTPGVGIVILASVLKTAGVPTTGIALIIGVDRILDMSRTTVNVAGDMVASIILDRLLGARFAGLREIVEEKRREEERLETGEDVIIEQ